MGRRRTFAVVVSLQAVLAVLAGACSDPPSKPAPAIPGGATGAGSGGGGGSVAEGGADADAGARLDAGEGGVCNDVALTGLVVDRTGVVGDPPVATGGTVVDGTYDLTSYTVYVGASGVGGPTGITEQATLRIAGGRIDAIEVIGGTGKTTTTITTSSTYSATSATLAESDLCPIVGAGRQLQFTAADPLLTLTDLSSKEAFTFTKR